MLNHENRTLFILAAGGLLSFASIHGCLVSEVNLNYCATANGDLFCARIHPEDGRDFCIRGTSPCLSALPDEYSAYKSDPDFDGCMESRPQDACYSPCGGGLSFEEEGSCVGGTAGDGGSSTEVGTTGMVVDGTTAEDATTVSSAGDTSTSATTDGPSGCEEHGDCVSTPDTPGCNAETGQCVACDQVEDGDQACAAASEVTPHCQVDSGVCVECTRHEQCDIGACDIFDGGCFSDQAEVLEINELEGDDLATRIAAFGAIEEMIVRVGPVGNNLVAFATGPVVLTNSQTVAILGFSTTDGVRPEIGLNLDMGMNSDAALMDVEAGSTVYFQNVRLSNNDSGSSSTVDCDGGRLDGRRSFFTSAGNNDVVLSGCEARLENVFLEAQQDDRPVVYADSSSVVALSYATIVGASGQDDTTDSLVVCAGMSQVEIRNTLALTLGGSDESILFADTVAGDPCESYQVSNSVLENAPLFGPTNRALEVPAINNDGYGAWFSFGPYLNQDTIDTDLAPEGFSYLEIAVPQPGDDDMDINGDSRVLSAVVGADVVPPPPP